MTLASITFVVLNFLVVCQAIPNCFRGSYYDGKKCSQCPPGTYRELLRSRKDSCTPCPAGTFNPHFGVGSRELCWKCAPNFFSEKNSSICTPCPTGLVAGRGSTSCVTCKMGSYPTTNYWGRPRCALCEQGTYKDNVNDASCTECPEGLASKKGSTSLSDCYKCPAGKFMSTEVWSGCKPCSEGRFKSTIGADYCDFCPPGTFASKTGAKKCDPCPAGTRSVSSGDKCRACAEGHVTYSEGQSVCRKLGFKCPKNTVEGPSGDCLICAQQHYLSESFECTPCPLGSYSSGGNARSCTKCPGRQFALDSQEYCRCPLGEFISPSGTCSKCPPGTYQRGGYSDPDRCEECPRSSIAVGWGTSSCQSCPEGLIANENRTNCVECGPGLTPIDRFSSRGDEYCVNITTGCPPGFNRRDVGPPCNVYHCRANTPPEEVGKTCLPCEKGYALLKEGKGCRVCPDGYVSDGGVITECRKCPNGLQKDSIDWSKCSCTTYGYGMQNGTCAECPPGSAADWGETTCTDCSPGTYSLFSGQGNCWNCPEGTAKANAGRGNCKTCPVGFTGNRKEGATKCVKEWCHRNTNVGTSLHPWNRRPSRCLSSPKRYVCLSLTVPLRPMGGRKSFSPFLQIFFSFDVTSIEARGHSFVHVSNTHHLISRHPHENCTISYASRDFLTNKISHFCVLKIISKVFLRINAEGKHVLLTRAEKKIQWMIDNTVKRLSLFIFYSDNSDKWGTVIDLKTFFLLRGLQFVKSVIWYYFLIKMLIILYKPRY